MSHQASSVKVILVALIANLGIALSKLIGAMISGSSALLAEAIHSLADCMNQVLLLLGNKASQKAPDETHPLGYGKEAFFWSFIVATLLFSMGGLFAVYEGFHRLLHPEPVSSPWLGLGILVTSTIIEALSFRTCYLEIQKHNSYPNLWQWFKNTKSSEQLVVLTEDTAALVGLVIATVCLGLTWSTGQSYWDAVGSILVGITLIVVAALLAIEIKSFIIGEAPSEDIREFLAQETPKFFPGGAILRFIAIHTGPSQILVSYKLHPGDQIKDLDQAIELVNQLESITRAKFKTIQWQFVELDKVD